jgi:DNA-binding NtrC family response regulator
MMRLVFQIAQQAPAPQAEAKTAAQRSLRLLIIDDDPFVLDSMRTVLELDGHVVVDASGGQQGIDAFRADPSFDAVITDLGMPGVSGKQVIETIKAESPKTPVVLLTGWGRRLDNTGEISGVTADFELPKPPDLDALRAVFAKLAR